MQILSDIVNYLLSLGAAIFVPIIIIIAGLLVKMKFKDALSAGITLGVAFYWYVNAYLIHDWCNWSCC